MNSQKTVDLADLHAKEEVRETAGELYRHAPLPYYLTPEGQREQDSKINGEWVRKSLGNNHVHPIFQEILDNILKRGK